MSGKSDEVVVKYEIWIKAADTPDQVEHWRHKTACVYIERDGVALPDVVLPPHLGEVLAAHVVALTHAIADLTSGAKVEVVSDQGSFVGAFGPGGWLETRWRPEHFKKRPKTPELWKTLSDLMDARRLTVTARLAKLSERDTRILHDLQARIEGRPMPRPGDVVDEPGIYYDTDGWMRRAMDRDRTGDDGSD